MSAFNELAQWAVLAFLAVFVLGLTRQLGRFILPLDTERPGIPPVQGPPIGARLSPIWAAPILDAVAAAADPAVPTAVVVVRDRCASCDVLLDALEASPRRCGVVALITDEASDAHVDRVARIVDQVVADPDGQHVKDLLVVATPFVLLIGPDGEVVHKQLGGTVDNAFEDLVRRTRPDDLPPADDVELSTVFSTPSTAPATQPTSGGRTL